MLGRIRLVIAAVAAFALAKLILRNARRAGRDLDPVPIADQISRALSDRSHGWWVAAVLEAFRFLESDFGYQLAEVHLHFRGTYLRYEGPVFDFVIEYDPEDTGSIHAELWVRQDQGSDVTHPRAFNVSDVLVSKDPALVVPDPRHRHLDQVAVLAAINVWATGLRELVPEIPRGEWPEGVQVQYLR